MLTWLAIFIAAIAVLINALSLNTTTQSLDLTRQSLLLMSQTIRPFLCLTDVRYSPGSQSNNPMVRFIVRNTGPLSASKINISFELNFGDNFIHGGECLPSLKPDNSREVDFTLTPDVKEWIPNNKESSLKIDTSVYVLGSENFYHSERHFSIPQEIRALDKHFDFVFATGGEHD